MPVVLDNKTPLGKLVLTNLYMNGKNLAWLAEQIDVDISHLSILCSKTKNPKVQTLLKISKVLNIEISELYNAVAENLENVN